MKKDLESKIKILEKENERLKAKINELKKDPLTKAYTRRFLDHCIQKEYLEKLKRNPKWFYNVYLIDLNNLHDVNRKEGYEAGDKYIKNAINFINKKFNEKKASYRIFRIGGDEFIIISQPYDYIDTKELKNDSFEISHKIWRYPEKYKNVLKKLDAEIIRNKKSSKFVSCRDCILNKHPELLDKIKKEIENILKENLNV